MDARDFALAFAGFAPGLGPSRAARRKVSLMLRCQPSPRARKCAMTSWSRRSEICSFVGAFCGPRRRRNASTASGMTSIAGRPRAHISSVISNASGSRAIPARISTSSSSDIVANCRRARWCACRHNLSCIFDIPSHVFLLCPPKADNPEPFIAARENQNMQAHTDVPDGGFTKLAIVLAIIDKGDCRVPVEFNNGAEVEFMFANIGSALRFIPLILVRSPRHAPQPNVPIVFGQENCSYNKVGLQA